MVGFHFCHHRSSRHTAFINCSGVSTLEVDLELDVAGTGTTVEVNATAANLDVTQSMIQGQITSTTIDSIPLNGRNFLELAYLIPGNRPAPTFDPTKTNTLEVSSAGGFGRGGNITVDGGDNNDEVVGGTLSNFPEDSVQEFQIATGRFTAEVGRSGNSIVNVVTKAGTNRYHGSAFIFERNRNLQALPATFNRSLPTPPFDREQYGGSIGGPIRQDRAWWFSSVEYRNQNAAIQTGARDFATDSILNTSASAPLRDALWSSRIDTQLNKRNSLMFRYSFNRSTDTAEATPSQNTASFSAAERQNSLNRFNSLVGALNTVLTNTRVNNLSYHFDNFYNDIPPYPQNLPTTNPQLGLTNELIFPDLADGENFNLPQITHLNRFKCATRSPGLSANTRCKWAANSSTTPHPVKSTSSVPAPSSWSPTSASPTSTATARSTISTFPWPSASRATHLSCPYPFHWYSTAT